MKREERGGFLRRKRERGSKDMGNTLQKNKNRFIAYALRIGCPKMTASGFPIGREAFYVALYTHSPD